jgi:mono/diheme cytochrome c family protein
MPSFRFAPARIAALALVAVVLVAPAAAHASERPVALKPGEARELVQSRCAACHSLDYVLMNSPFLSPEQWQASVTKMRTFGAPLTDDEARAIAAYLASAYGKPPG